MYIIYVYVTYICICNVYTVIFRVRLPVRGAAHTSGHLRRNHYSYVLLPAVQ